MEHRYGLNLLEFRNLVELVGEPFLSTNLLSLFACFSNSACDSARRSTTIRDSEEFVDHREFAIVASL